MAPYEESESSINHAGGVHQLKGLSMQMAAIFIIGEVAGTGVLAIPSAMMQSGWTGIAMIGACCLIAAYSGIRLSSCWMLIQDKNARYRDGVRDPFPIIAYEAMGDFGRHLIAAITYVQLIGAGVIYLLLASENMASLLSMWDFYFCEWTIVIAVVMCPLSMLGTPKDFWPVAVGAMGCTGIACVLIFTQQMRQIPEVPLHDSEVTFKTFFVSFGTFLFCFGGGVMFPTIQTDMVKPAQFSKSVAIAFIALLVFFYLPVAVGGFYAFAGTTKDNIIDNMAENWLKTTVLVLMTGHLLLALNIILNPVYQGIEQSFGAPAHFGWKRVVIRASVMVFVLFIAQSIPNFGPILSFIGGSTVSSSSYILPLVFYWLLCRKPEYSKPIHRFELAVMAICVVVSVFGGIAATYASINALFSADTFKKPCYLNEKQHPNSTHPVTNATFYLF